LVNFWSPEASSQPQFQFNKIHLWIGQNLSGIIILFLFRAARPGWLEHTEKASAAEWETQSRLFLFELPIGMIAKGGETTGQRSKFNLMRRF
jgi:hypothetical protein